jgi:hypothetical protein
MNAVMGRLLHANATFGACGRGVVGRHGARFRGRVMGGLGRMLAMVSVVVGLSVGFAGSARSDVRADAGSPAASDWPEFMRGVNHQGLNTAESSLSAATVGRLRVAWSRPIRRSGWTPNSGSPIVVGNVVYVGGGDVRAYDRTTGALLWRRGVGAPVLTTPAYQGGAALSVEARHR